MRRRLVALAATIRNRFSMIRAKKSWSVWRRFAVTCALGGLMVPMIIFCLDRRPSLSHLVRNYINGMVFAACIGLLLGFTMPRLWVICDHRPKWLKWIMLVAAMLLGAFVGSLPACGVFVLLGSIQPEDFWTVYEQSVRFSIVITLILGGGAMMYEVLRERLERTTLQLRTEELERERALKLASEARLSSLESRIHPHFLFNTINSVSALIREDPLKAERVLEQMAALLRFSLDSGHSGMVPLERELKIVRDYLEIERVRFGQRLRFQVEAGADVSGIEIPPLAVQTLVENSVKYAISPRREGGEVRVRAQHTGERLRLVVEDDGPGFEVEALKPGHGIDTLQARLLTLYGTEAALDLQRIDGGMQVTLSLPLRQPVLHL